MNTDSLIRFIQYEQRYNFDEQLESRYPAEDLDQEKYADFIEKCGISPHYNPEDILVNLGLAIYENKRWRLNNAGILFLGNNPTHYLPQSVVTCVLYKGDEKLHVLDRKDFSGGLLLNMEDAMLFLKKHLKLRYEIKSLRRNEILELPEDALREALVNALAHRNYFEKGANVLVEIFDSSVKITNPGGLPKGLSKKDLGKKSMTRNPLITAMLLRAEYIEKLDTGINRIQYALQQAGLPQAQFEADSFFNISFPRESLEKDTSSDKNSEENRKKIREKTREKTSVSLLEKSLI